MAIAPDRLQRLARRILEAESSGRPIVPEAGEFDGLSLEEGYRIQELVAALKRESGLRHAGWKTMGTNAAIRERVGVTEPARGHLFAPAIIEAGSVDVEGWTVWAEPEIAFVMERDVAGPDVTPEGVLSATREVCGAIELAWSRFEGPRAPPADVADNALAGRAVLSSRRLSPRDAGDLTEIAAELFLNGEPVRTGTGAEVYGSPAAAVAWLANHLASHGLALEAGQVIISGSLTLPVQVKAGDVVRANFTTLGAVEARIS